MHTDYALVDLCMTRGETSGHVIIIDKTELRSGVESAQEVVEEGQEIEVLCTQVGLFFFSLGKILVVGSTEMHQRVRWAGSVIKVCQDIGLCFAHRLRTSVAILVSTKERRGCGSGCAGCRSSWPTSTQVNIWVS